MKLGKKTLRLFGLLGALALSSSVFAGGTLNMFGRTYNVSDPINVQGSQLAATAPSFDRTGAGTTASSPAGTVFQGDGTYNGCGGQGLFFVAGANAAADRLFICDETGNGGAAGAGNQSLPLGNAGGSECAAFLTGTDAGTSAFGPTSSINFISAPQDAGADLNIFGITWITDTNAAAFTGKNVIMVLDNAGGLIPGGSELLVTLDRDRYDALGTAGALASLKSDTSVYSSMVSNSAGAAPMTAVTALCGNGNPNTGSSPTKIYLGGTTLRTIASPTTDTVANPTMAAGQTCLAYKVYDVASGAMLNDNAVIMDNLGDGSQSSPSGGGRQFYDLATDGTNFYATILEPQSIPLSPTGSGWMSMYKLTTMPDPSASGETQHPTSRATVAATRVRLDSPDGSVGVQRPSLSGNYDAPGNPAQTAGESRIGTACGRMVNGAPVFYILSENLLYTLVPQAVATPTPTPGPSATATATPGAGATGTAKPNGIGQSWFLYE